MAAGHDETLMTLRAIGYQEAGELLAGRISRVEAELRVSQRTAQLAKRQRTWFRHQIEGLRLVGDVTRVRLDRRRDLLAQLDGRFAGAGRDRTVETWDRLSRVARALGPKWQQANPPSVIHLFSRVGLTQMVERSGLRVVSVASTSKLVSVGHLAGVAAHRYGVLGRSAQRVAQATRMTKVTVPYRLGDVVTLVAIKP